MIRETDDRAALGRFLRRHAERASYFIGDLSERYWPRCRWFAKWDDGNIRALVLLYRHPTWPTILTLGPTEDIEHIARQCAADWPVKCHAHLQVEHVDPMGVLFRLSGQSPVLQMACEPGCFMPRHISTGRAVVQLKRSDEPQIKSLLNDYPENFFAVEDLDSGYYVGIYEDSTLLSMAGVHVVSSEFGVAALGNIVTKSDRRRQGYAIQCTQELVRRLLEIASVVTLNVVETNAPAIAMYRGLGFKTCGRLVLAFCERLSRE
jgi:ribosomal protein S18 acetylase RimI-like enzyme